MDDSYTTDYYNSLVNAMSGCRQARGAYLVQPLHSTIVHLKDHLENKGVNIAHPCTGGTENDCWIFSHLTVWNQILYVLNGELREETPGLLTLCSLDCIQSPRSTKEEILSACIAVHWLLKEHHCISTVELYDDRLLKDHAFLFCNALSVSKAVKSVLLDLSTFNNIYDTELTAAVGRMTCLDKLILFPSRMVTLKRSGSFEDMGVSVGSTNTLTELSVFHTKWPSDAVAFLNGARTCTNLRYLCVSHTMLGNDGADSLSDVLRSNPDLEEIKLESISFGDNGLRIIAEKLTATPLLKLQKLHLHSCRFYASALSLLSSALQKHEALISLEIVDCDLDCTQLQSLVHGLDHSACLRELCLDSNRIMDMGAATLAEYLGVARKLQVLSLKSNMLSSNGVMAIVEASIRKRSSTELYFGYVRVNEDEAHKITKILETAGTSERVQIIYNHTGCFQLGRVLRTNNYKLDQIVFDRHFELMPEHFVELFGSLSCNYTVKHLALETGEFDEASARELGYLLSTNKTLKSLELGATLEPSHAIVLFKNLAKNTSVSRLVLYNSVLLDISTAHVFVRMLKTNRTVNELRSFVGGRVALRILAKGLPHNYTLLELGVLPRHHRNMFDVAEVRRRNYALLNKAAKFVLMKSSERSLALAFEKVCMNDSLTSHLKRTNRLSEEAAKMHIRHAARYITDWYPVLSGIVKEKLECCWNSCDTVQIDQLSAECLQKIFSYLTLEDVRQTGDEIDGKI